MEPPKVSLVRIVTDFYGRVLESPNLARYFDGVSMEGLITHQTAFINAIGGASPSHSDEQLVEAHADLGISDDDFDQLIRLLTETLLRHGVGSAGTDEIVGQFEERRELVVASS